MARRRNVKGLDRKELTDARVRSVVAGLPRERFLPEELRRQATEDRALPIGSGQTISQPFMVALMTQAAGIQEGSRVLEVGTGSGYQAAVLAELGAVVFTIETIHELAEQARSLLSELGYSTIKFREGDGWSGWEEAAPFDAILVTAAAPRVPQLLLSQLAVGGKLVVPIESTEEEGEELFVFERTTGGYKEENLGRVRFVPLVGEARSATR